MNSVGKAAGGWISRFEIALETKRRIILHGNVLDHVLEPPQPPRPFVEWLQGRLEQRGYRRIVAYDFGERPTILLWDDLTPDQAWGEFVRVGRQQASPMEDLGRPELALQQLRRLLNNGDAPSCVIVRNPELRVNYPSEPAVGLQRLTDLSAAPNEPLAPNAHAGESEFTPSLQNLAIFLYTRESNIPPEFVAVDPDSVLLIVPRPNFQQRKAFFEQSWDRFYHDPEDRGDGSLDRLARISEGYRMAELEQLIPVSRSEQIGIEHFELLRSLTRSGRKDDPWQHIPLNRAAEFFESHYRIRGQDDVIADVIDSFYRAKHSITGLIDDTVKRPPIVLFFVGSTGVGKTMLARAIAEFLTGSSENCKIFDMSEYRQDHTDQRLIGPPPGYVGFSEGGHLTNWIKERPWSVVVIEEVEKGHVRILDLFLQILDGARLTDGKGETVDFSETVLIFTSNIGTADGKYEGLEKTDRKAVADYFTSKVQQYFETPEVRRPELYNRLKQGVVVFNFIERDIADQVIRDKLTTISATVTARLRQKGSNATLRYDATADEMVVMKLLDRVDYANFGLRDVINTIIVKLGPALARFLEDCPAQGLFHFGWREHGDRASVEALR